MATRIIGSLVVALTASTAAAPPAPAPAPAPRQAYRLMVIGGDALAMTFVVGFGALAYRSRDCDCEDFSGEGVILGLGMYLAYPSVAHSIAGHHGRAAASVALRIALPTLAGYAADRAGAGERWSVAAAGAGMLTAMAVDWFVLADGTMPAPPPKTALFVTPVGGGAVAGIGGVLP